MASAERGNLVAWCNVSRCHATGWRVAASVRETRQGAFIATTSAEKFRGAARCCCAPVESVVTFKRISPELEAGRYRTRRVKAHVPVYVVSQTATRCVSLEHPFGL